MSRLFCTIITKNYLAWARALARSLREHVPDAEIVAYLLDPIEGWFDPAQQPFEVRQAEELLEPALYRSMCFYYTPTELSCAMRPFVHQRLLARPEVSELYYFDSDMMVTHSLEVVFEQMQDCQVLLTPHTRQPVPPELDRRPPLEQTLLRYGLYNGGFLGLRPGADSAAMLSWWGDHLVRKCFCDYRGFYLDQLWLNLIPLLFKQCKVADLPGANLGYWNIHEAPDTVPLFIHFSGWNPQQPAEVGLFFPDCRPVPAFQVWGPRFRALLDKEGWDESCRYPYTYSCYLDGERIAGFERRLYFELTEAGQWPGADPFAERQFLQRYLNLGPRLLRRSARILRRMADKLESWTKP